jgi:hypothetical protein
MHPDATPSATPARATTTLGWWLRWIAGAVLVVVLLILAAWSALVMDFCLPAPSIVQQAAALAVLVVAVVAMWRARSWTRRVAWGGGVFALGLVVFFAQAASNDRTWTRDMAVLPWAEFNGDRVTIHNIRSCTYRSETDYTVAHHDDTFDLSHMTGVDLFHVFWGSPNIAHTMLSFGFDDGRHVCLSVETRREQGETYDALRGFFRQYELAYVFADETDLVKLRTNFRGEQVYLYPLAVPLDAAKAVFVEYLRAATDLREHPQWYNALTDNCTTTLIGQSRRVATPNARFDWRWVVNGHLHEVMYERGTIDNSIPLPDLRQRCFINDRARSVEDDAGFSRRIRTP